MKLSITNIKIVLLVLCSCLLINCSNKSDESDDGTSSNNAELTITGVLNDFGEVQIETNSSVKSLLIRGLNLTTAVTIESTHTDFELSLDSNNYSTLISIPPTDVNDQIATVFIRFSPSTNSLGGISGELLISNSESNTNFSRDLSGIGIPVTHNYQAFSNQPLGFGGGFSQSAQQTFMLHDDLSNIETINMFLEIDCPSTGCDDWDRFANVKVKDPATGNWYEIGRYITPYWVGTELLPKGLQFDVTDFKSLLTGNVELRIYIEFN